MEKIFIDLTCQEAQNKQHKKMPQTKEQSIEKAKADLAKRLGIEKGEVKEKHVTDEEFSDMSLGAPAEDEMAAQMISYGWRIALEALGKTYEYRADKYQMRLVNFKGSNHLLKV